jgi:CheY-like chemotaxis protein
MGTGPADGEDVQVPATTPALSVLVIDDEAAVRETLSEMLEALGHQVVLADSGYEAVQKLAAVGDFDFVFTDLAMPEMDGWETAREIRKRRPEMRIVLVTGYGPGTVPPAGEENLVDGILGKPFDFAQVGDTIRSILAKKAVLENVGA